MIASGSSPLIFDPTVLDRVLMAARPGRVVVFDLDSTLIDNRPRQARILREFGAATGLAALANARSEHFSDWDLAGAMIRVGLAAAEAHEHAEPAKQFWRERFFTSEYCSDDVAIPGAPEFLAAVAARGATIAYYTGRHEAMRPGTVDSFVRLGLFSPGERVQLVMKPDLALGDDAWKASVPERLRGLGEVVAAFDNEPTHVNSYRQAFPAAIVVHLATDHSGRPVTLLPGVVSIRDFRRPAP